MGIHRVAMLGNPLHMAVSNAKEKSGLWRRGILENPRKISRASFL